MIKFLTTKGHKASSLNKMSKDDVTALYEQEREPKFALPAPVQKKKSKRGRPTKDMPGMRLLVANWDQLEVGEAYPLPDYEGEDDHGPLTLARHHFKKYAEPAGLKAGSDYSIEGHPEVGATITRKK